jgi:hypothetical protein
MHPVALPYPFPRTRQHRRRWEIPPFQEETGPGVLLRNIRCITVDLGETQISLDLQAMHGQRFHIDQLGGYENWYRMPAAAKYRCTKCKQHRDACRRLRLS